MEQFNVKIVGLGEGGARAVNRMISEGVGKDKAVEFICVGNDENIMLTSATRKNLFLNRDLTTIYKNFSEAFVGAKVIFIVGGLGSNAARIAIPIITSCAKNFGAVTVAFVCRPFTLENHMRKINADYTLTNLRGKVDTLFVLPAEKFFLFRMKQKEVSLGELFDVANDIFCRGVKIFLDLLSNGDSSIILLKWGNAAFGYGAATNALEAVKNAAKFPALEEDDITSAEGVFVRLTSGKNLKLSAVEAANSFIKNKLKTDAAFFSQEEIDAALGRKVFASIIITRKAV